MRSSSTKRPKPPKRGFIRNLLTFERLVTGPLAVLIYWAGLALILLIGCFAVGAAVGLALHNGESAGMVLAVPVVVGGALLVSALVLIWRALCEFYVAIFRISDDLRALRLAGEALATHPSQPAPEIKTPRPTPAPAPVSKPVDVKPAPETAAPATAISEADSKSETPLETKPDVITEAPAAKSTPLSF
jgi:hypothetical protein